MQGVFSGHQNTPSGRALFTCHERGRGDERRECGGMVICGGGWGGQACYHPHNSPPPTPTHTPTHHTHTLQLALRSNSWRAMMRPAGSSSCQAVCSKVGVGRRRGEAGEWRGQIDAPPTPILMGS